MSDFSSSETDFHVPSSYVCSFSGCGSVFKRASRLRTHLLVHSGERPYACTHEGCDKKYTRLQHLNRHVAISHSQQSPNKSVPTYSCSHDGCTATLKTSCALKKHEKAHIKRQYVCKQCNKAFIKHQHLTTHEFEHTGIPPYKCPVEGCGKAFKVPSKLKVHKKVHEGYLCNYPDCSMKFDTWSKLLKHKVSHNEEARCKVCSKCFSSQQNLRSHSIIHEKTREEYHCPYENCLRSYYYERNMCYHISRVHERKKYKCPQEGCNKEFKHKVNIKRHLKTHSQTEQTACKRTKKKRQSRKRRSVASKFTGVIDKIKELEILNDTSGEDCIMGSPEDSNSNDVCVMKPIDDSNVKESSDLSSRSSIPPESEDNEQIPLSESIGIQMGKVSLTCRNENETNFTKHVPSINVSL